MKYAVGRIVVPLVLYLTAPALAAQGRRPHPAPPPGTSAETPSTTKVIAYSPREVARIRTKLRYTTLIVLPKDEVILDFVCGDKDLWVISGDQNFAYIKPAKENAETNLNLITESGNVYSFVLTELSGTRGGEPDLKVFIESKDAASTESSPGTRRFVSARELEDSRQQTRQAQDETRRAKDSTEAAVNAGIRQFVTNVRFAYRFEAGKKPFYVRAMSHDDRFTYIQARPEETPTLYELVDGQPNLVNFDFDPKGVFVVQKILDRGYLVIGKQKLGFSREE